MCASILLVPVMYLRSGTGSAAPAFDVAAGVAGASAGAPTRTTWLAPDRIVLDRPATAGASAAASPAVATTVRPGVTSTTTSLVTKPAAPTTTVVAPRSLTTLVNVPAVAAVADPGPGTPTAGYAETTTTVARTTTTTKSPLIALPGLGGQPVTAQKSPAAPSARSDEGLASWFNAPDGSCAHRTLPAGTVITVTRVATGVSTTCVVDQYGPSDTSRVIDLSMDTFEKLADPGAGLISVAIQW